jgi:FixJ family two-component response regulator
MDKEQPTVVVIDDDPAIRESLGRLLRSAGLKSQLWSSVDEFLASGRPNGPACLVLDVRLSGRSGLDYQRELTAAETRIPVIFITGYADIRMSVQAMKGGAIEILTKPFRDQDLLDAVQLALAQDRAWRENE